MGEPAETSAEAPPPLLTRILRSPLAWLGGVLSAVAAAVLGPWAQGGGQDLLENVLGRPPLAVPVVEEHAPGPGPVAFRSRPSSAADRAVLLTAPSDEEFAELSRRHDGGAVERLDVTITVESRRSDLRIVDIRPRVRRSTAILTGAYFLPDTSGEAPVISLNADFDRPPVLLLAGEKGKKPYFTGKQIDLKRGERETLVISFLSHRAAVEFDLQVLVVTGGRRMTQTIGGTDGGLFRVTGAARDHHAYRAVYAEEGRTWHRAGGKTLCAAFPASRGCRR
ncbi:hypothetical protein AB0D67_36370 [Streptosporangium sp. NPDC048047]|uniref:hypothetical protein n=1 Tax=Streptosporangium sp. NPDC048047 TaxID=3155748 RepID=UPI00343268C0